jgi:hypothetical protein
VGRRALKWVRTCMKLAMNSRIGPGISGACFYLFRGIDKETHSLVDEREPWWAKGKRPDAQLCDSAKGNVGLP